MKKRNLAPTLQILAKFAKLQILFGQKLKDSSTDGAIFYKLLKGRIYILTIQNIKV